MPTSDAARGSTRHANRWSPLYFALAGVFVGALTGVVLAWIDYGRAEIGFMYNYVLGLALIFGVIGWAVAALRNWLRRNPMA